MSNASDEFALEQSSILLEKLARHVEGFLAAWDNADEDAPPVLADHLPTDNGTIRHFTLVELIKTDLEFRLEGRGLPKRLHDYLEEFPELHEHGVPADLVYEEFHLRQQAGLAVDPQEYLEAFPNQADELRCLLDLNQPYESTQVCENRTGPTSTELQPGQTVDDFELLTRLGEGAFAQVFLARQTSMQRLVALKVSADHGTEPQTLAQLDHDHIVRVFDQRVVPDQKLRLLYMQYVSGGTLQSVVQEFKQTPPAEQFGSILLRAVDRSLETRGESRPVESALRAKLKSSEWGETVCWIGSRLASALEYAHQRGVLHRDLKPANVLVTSEGVPKLADFNISFSSKLDGATPAAYFGGSLAYMSPEQLEACNPACAREPSDLDGRSDLYSLGVMLWELLTGSRPFVDRKENGPWSNSLNAMIERRQQGITQEALANVPENCPPGLIRVLQKCLEFDRNKRWKSGAELAQQLELCRYPHAQQIINPPEQSRCHRLRKFAGPVIVCAAVLPHVFLGVFNNFYNQEAIVSNLHESRAAFEQIRLIVNAIAYPLGLLATVILMWPLLKMSRPRERDMFDETAMKRARNRCLNLGHYTGMIGVAEWCLAGIAYPVSIHLAAGSMPGIDYAHFFGSLVLCGLIAAAYPFFGVTYFCFRVIYPCLLHEGLIDKDDLASLQKMVHRAGIYLASAGMAPLLGVLATLFITENTAVQRIALQVFATVGFLGLAVTYLVYRRMQTDVEALTEAVGGHSN